MTFSQLTATNQWALLLGSFSMAYSPLIFLFLFIVYPKPQLMIVVTSYAFAYLLSATTSSILYTIMNAIFQFNQNNNNNNNIIHSDYSTNVFSSDGVLAAIIPSILLQFVFRCLFTSLYHKVERVIQLSLQRQEEEEEDEQRLTNGTAGGSSSNNNNGTVDAMVGTSTTTNTNDYHQNNNNNTTSHDIIKFKLALNDGSAAVAAAVGFGGMQAITLYGTLLSSEAVNNTTGILYQNSCPAVPSLVVSAMVTNLFSILQIFWMLLTFFGMRRRLLFHRGECAEYEEQEEEEDVVVPEGDDDDENHRRARLRRRRTNKKSGRWFGNSRSGGNYALLLVLLTHTAASFITLFHRQVNGCYIVLPSLFGIVLLTAYLFYMGCGRIYMPNTNTPTTTTMTRVPPIASATTATPRIEGYQSHSE